MAIVKEAARLLEIDIDPATIKTDAWFEHIKNAVGFQDLKDVLDANGLDAKPRDRKTGLQSLVRWLSGQSEWEPPSVTP